MVWLLAVVVVILLVVSAGFRKAALWMAGLAVAGGAIIFAVLSERRDTENAAALARIPVSALGFENVSLDTKYGYKLLGRIKNNSAKFSLKKVGLVVTMQDCPTETSPPSCVIIGQESVSVYLDIPPGQARDFQQSLYFSGGTLKPRGLLRWNYSILQTEGK